MTEYVWGDRIPCMRKRAVPGVGANLAHVNHEIIIGVRVRDGVETVVIDANCDYIEVDYKAFKNLVDNIEKHVYVARNGGL